MTSKLAPRKQPHRFKREAFDIYDGEVKIYRTTSKTWQFQMWITEEQRYVRKTLDTENKEDAIANAKNKYIFYKAKIQNNEKVFSITAQELRNCFLVYVQNQVENRQLSKGRAANIKTSTNHYLDFVGKTAKYKILIQKNLENI